MPAEIWLNMPPALKVLGRSAADRRTALFFTQSVELRQHLCLGFFLGPALFGRKGPDPLLLLFGFRGLFLQFIPVGLFTFLDADLLCRGDIG